MSKVKEVHLKDFGRDSWDRPVVPSTCYFHYLIVPYVYDMEIRHEKLLKNFNITDEYYNQEPEHEYINLVPLSNNNEIPKLRKREVNYSKRSNNDQ